MQLFYQARSLRIACSFYPKLYIKHSYPFIRERYPRDISTKEGPPSPSSILFFKIVLRHCLHNQASLLIEAKRFMESSSGRFSKHSWSMVACKHFWQIQCLTLRFFQFWRLRTRLLKKYPPTIDVNKILFSYWVLNYDQSYLPIVSYRSHLG